MGINDILAKGATVRLRRISTSLDAWTTGRVIMMSKNRKSILVDLDGAVRTEDGGIIVGMLPLAVDYALESLKGLDGTEYTIERENRSEDDNR